MIVINDSSYLHLQHIHRLGRAARAGELGRAINLWDGQGSSNELVKLIQKAGSGITLDMCFSRRRGLRKGIRKQQQRQKNTCEKKNILLFSFWYFNI